MASLIWMISGHIPLDQSQSASAETVSVGALSPSRYRAGRNQYGSGDEYSVQFHLDAWLSALNRSIHCRHPVNTLFIGPPFFQP